MALFDKNTKFTQTSTDVKALEDAHIISQAHFPCKNCGSDLIYSPASEDLLCRSCGHHYPIDTSVEPIKEYDFNQAVNELSQLRQASGQKGLNNKEVTIITFE